MPRVHFNIPKIPVGGSDFHISKSPGGDNPKFDDAPPASDNFNPNQNPNAQHQSTQNILDGRQPPVQPGPDPASSQSRPLSDYVIPSPKKMSPDRDAMGLQTYKGRKFAELETGGVALVDVDADGTVRAKLMSERTPTGPILRRNEDTNRWSEQSPDTTTPAHQADARSSGAKDGVTYYRASQTQLNSYSDAARQIDEMHVPLMHRKNDPDSRLFVAAFDGTGSDGDAEITGRSNVAEIAEHYKLVTKDDKNIEVCYVEGPGTQSNPFKAVIDQATGKSYPDRLNRMYSQLQEKAQKWYDENPNIRISVSNIGFSRGAEQAAGFARMVDNEGIWVNGKSGERINLVKDKQVIQSVGLFDPVGTGTPYMHDRSQPDSVVSGLQINAKDERRDQFPVTNIITNTDSNSPFRVVEVNGSHTDIGGGYELNGLSTRSGNLMRRYLNGLTDVRLDALPEPPAADPSNVIHRSEEGLPAPIYTTKHYDKNQTRPSVPNTHGHFFHRNKPASLVEPWSGMEHKLEYLPVGARLSGRSDNLLESGRAAVGNLNARLDPNRQGADEADGKLSTYAAYAARRSGMERIDRMELNGSGENAEITVYDSRGEYVKFSVRDALADSEETMLRRIAEYDANPI